MPRLLSLATLFLVFSFVPDAHAQAARVQRSGSAKVLVDRGGKLVGRGWRDIAIQRGVTRDLVVAKGSGPNPYVLLGKNGEAASEYFGKITILKKSGLAVGHLYEDSSSSGRYGKPRLFGDKVLMTADGKRLGTTLFTEIKEVGVHIAAFQWGYGRTGWSIVHPDTGEKMSENFDKLYMSRGRLIGERKHEGRFELDAETGKILHQLTNRSYWPLKSRTIR